jgi:uncharacterized protein (DUF2384 family)
MGSANYSERVVGIARLIGQVQAMAEACGDAKGFSAAEWLGRWIEEPLPALGGRRPSELIDTAEGQRMVAKLLDQVLSGAYA